MLRKIFFASALLCSTSFAAAGTQSIPVRPPAQGRPMMAPYGDFHGAWTSATVLLDGIVAGVLTDAIGQPLWMLDAKLTPSNGIQGELFALEYAGNPALVFSELLVMGDVVTSADGTNRFQLVIFDPKLDNPAFGQKPLYPFGFLEGELCDGRTEEDGGAVPGLASGKAPKGTSFGIGAVSSTHGMSAAGQQPNNGAIVCPWSGPRFEVKPYGVGQIASTHALAAAGQQPEGVISCPGSGKAPAHTHGTMGSFGHQIPKQGSGKVTGRWYVKD